MHEAWHLMSEASQHTAHTAQRCEEKDRRCTGGVSGTDDSTGASPVLMLQVQVRGQPRGHRVGRVRRAGQSGEDPFTDRDKCDGST